MTSASRPSHDPHNYPDVTTMKTASKRNRAPSDPRTVTAAALNANGRPQRSKARKPKDRAKRNGHRRKDNADQMRLALRREQVVTLHAQGATFRQIAHQIGVSKGTAFNDFHAVLNSTLDRIADKVDLYRSVEYERLEAQRVDIHSELARHREEVRTVQTVTDPKTKATVRVVTVRPALTFDEFIKAQRELRNLSQRTSALLGLDAPIKVTPTDISVTRPYEGMTPEQIDARLQESACESSAVARAINVTPLKAVASNGNGSRTGASDMRGTREAPRGHPGSV